MMKKIIVGSALLILCSTLSHTDNIDNSSNIYVAENTFTDDYYKNEKSFEDKLKDIENSRRSNLSTEERAVEDLEKENRFKQRQRDAEVEKKRLEQEKKNAEYEQKSTLEKAKSWFN